MCHGGVVVIKSQQRAAALPIVRLLSPSDQIRAKPEGSQPWTCSVSARRRASPWFRCCRRCDLPCERRLVGAKALFTVLKHFVHLCSSGKTNEQEETSMKDHFLKSLLQLDRVGSKWTLPASRRLQGMPSAVCMTPFILFYFIQCFSLKKWCSCAALSCFTEGDNTDILRPF